MHFFAYSNFKKNIFGKCFSRDVMRCVTWYHLCNLKNVKNTHGGVVYLVKLQGFSLQLY